MIFRLVVMSLCYLWCAPSIGAEIEKDNSVRERLNSIIKDKLLDSINQNEVEIEKFFLEHSNQSIETGSDLIIIGTVEKIKDRNAFAGYGTEVTISVDQVIKGEYKQKTVKVNLVSGKKIRVPPSKADRISHNLGYGRITLSSEPNFEIGEEMLICLSSIPRRLHFLYEIYSEPHPKDKQHLKDEWYIKKLQDGFEPRFKSTIKKQQVFWKGQHKDLSVAISEIIANTNTQGNQ